MTFVVNAGAPESETDKDFVITVPLFLHSLELVITSIYYNPALTLAILDRHDWTQPFFQFWFKHLPSFARVHDRKLGIAAICSLFEWLATVGDAPLSHNASQLLGGALLLFKGLPEAIVGALVSSPCFTRGQLMRQAGYRSGGVHQDARGAGRGAGRRRGGL